MSRITKLIGALALIVIALAAQLKRGDGISNLAHWLGALAIPVPASWQTPLADSVVTGLALTILSALVFWWTFRPKAGAEAAPAPRKSVPLVLYPDWSIGALFLHLQPSLNGVDDIEQRAEPTGLLVLEKLIAGDLKAWGKPDGAKNLRPIDPAFWRQASWTYWFLPDEKRNRDLVHATLPRAAAQYRDIHVNYAEAMALWPR